MSDSGMSVASSGPSSGLSDSHDHKSDEPEEEVFRNEILATVVDDDQKQLENAVKSSPRKCRLTSCNPYLSKSVMDLVGSSSPYLSHQQIWEHLQYRQLQCVHRHSHSHGASDTSRSC